MAGAKSCPPFVLLNLPHPWLSATLATGGTRGPVALPPVPLLPLPPLAVVPPPVPLPVAPLPVAPLPAAESKAPLQVWSKAQAPCFGNKLGIKEEAEDEAEPPAEHMQKLREWSERLKRASRCPIGSEGSERRFQELRAALKEEIAEEERAAAEAACHAEVQLQAKRDEQRLLAAGRVLSLDLSANLRDVRMLGASGTSMAALDEGISQLLVSLRRARAICQKLQEEEKQLDVDHQKKGLRLHEESRKRRLALVGRLAKARRKESEDSKPKDTDEAEGENPLDDYVGGVPLLAEIAQEAQAAQIDLLLLSLQLSRCVSGGKSHLQPLSLAAERLQGLLADAKIQPMTVGETRREGNAERRTERAEKRAALGEFSSEL